MTKTLSGGLGWAERIKRGEITPEEALKATEADWIAKHAIQPRRFEIGEIYKHKFFEDLFILVRNSPTHKPYGIYLNVVWCNSRGPIHVEDNVRIPNSAAGDWVLERSL